MEDLDEQSREVDDIDDEMMRAVAEERYVDAAALKKDMDRFVAGDALYSAMEELQAATDEERWGLGFRI